MAMQNRNGWQRLITAGAVALALGGCFEEQQMVTVYSLQKMEPGNKYGHDWMTLNPSTYRVRDGVVVEEVAGNLHRYEDCTTLNVENWECQYSDKSGSFGVRDGQFWRRPVWNDYQEVSRFRYNMVRCEWAVQDPYDSFFWGALRCVFGWR